MPIELIAKLPGPLLLRPLSWPAGCGALMTTRGGGVSAGPFAALNLRAQPGQLEDEIAVAENRRRFGATLSAVPVFLNQVHGVRVVRLTRHHIQSEEPALDADASITTVPGLACTVLVADCLPVLFASRDGRGVGAAHAGWRGLAAGVLEATVQALCEATHSATTDLVAWLGACIGPAWFEVGDDVREAFEADETCHFACAPARDGRRQWRADLVALARTRLQRLGLCDVSACDLCTASDPARFYSFRRDGLTGRLAAAAWINPV